MSSQADVDADEHSSQEDETLIAQRSSAASSSSFSSMVKHSCLYVLDGGLDTVVPLAVLGFLAICVLLFNVTRPQVTDCGDSSRFAKHFYCFNASQPPGVHVDQ